MLRGRGALEPTPRLGGYGHQRRHPKTGIDGVKEIRTIPIEAIGHKILERESPLAPDSL
jgi:hypothetical protein